MARFSLHAVAPNRPGLVAAVTQALADIGCNLEDSRMSLLHGQFSIVLVLEAPGTSSGTVIEEALAPLLEELGLELFIRPIPNGSRPPESGTFVDISVRGADQPGTVSRIARAIAASGGDITDLVGHVVLEGAVDPSELAITAAIDRDSVVDLRTRLQLLATELRMTCDVVESGAHRG